MTFQRDTAAKMAIVGAACRLPGAKNEAAFRDVLNKGLFTVGRVPKGRWHEELAFHPGKNAAGSAYTFAGGFLPDPYDFDIGVFGMSPREAVQVDPQQRLLAELVWEALENARIAPASIAGKEVGVYIGVSALDHANLFGGDPGAIESHFMTGNTLSIVANRISYLFDLKGPSFIVDTACSSSLVAVERALADLRSGRVDTAIVGGVNMLLSPASFVGFSRAQMLSPTGACRPFSARGDGYVRSEGGVVFVLQRSDVADPGAIRAIIKGASINSDGRTSGIALPGLSGQTSLLERAYAEAGVSPEDLAFVEAHGTGTVVGDPIEATAIGTVLGRPRSKPLPMGSVKSNIGHLEPASGVAGMMKALIALEQHSYPATLHLDGFNPYIDFAALNLQPAAQAVALGEGILHCGVSSFGFGGTNAHVILSSAPEVAAPASSSALDALVLSSHCKESLAALAGAYADRLEQGVDPAALAGAVADGRALMRQRAVLPLGDGAVMAAQLRALSTGGKSARLATGTALSGAVKVCFAYNGNGSQFVGMGRDAYGANAAFRRAFDAADAAFVALGHDGLAEAMLGEDLADKLELAEWAQPLIFAIQVGLTAALAERGLTPAMVLGHSVGEIAAAYAAGILTLDQAARILMARAHSQETVHGVGTMATLASGRAAMAELIERSGIAGIDIAASNGPNSITVSGSDEAITAFMRFARKNRVAGRQLDIAYPYHSALLDRIEDAFLAELGEISPTAGAVPMISTVTGDLLAGAGFDSAYWWQNIRHEVMFSNAVRKAAERGANLFLEIGPRMILCSAMAGTVEAAGFTGRALHSLSDAAGQGDPIAEILARAIANGLDPQPVGGQVDRSIDLPTYPWQRKTYAYTPTSSALDVHGIAPRHPLIGARLVQGAPEWRNVLDAQLVPYLADHVVGGEVVVPATALAEMMLAVARDLWGEGGVCVEDFDILQPLVLGAEEQREISTRLISDPASVEIWSRPRFSPDEWHMHARGRIARAPKLRGEAPKISDLTAAHDDADEIYRKARQSDIDYGPSFSLLRTLRRQGEEILETTQAVPAAGTGAYGKPQVLHPASVDAAFHGLFDYVTEGDENTKTWLPIRFERLTVWREGADVTDVTIVVDKSGEQLKTVTLWMRDDAGRTVARLDKALLRAVARVEKPALQGVFHLATPPAGLTTVSRPLAQLAQGWFETTQLPVASDGWLLLHAHMRASAIETLRDMAGPDGLIDLLMLLDPPALDKTGGRPAEQRAWISELLLDLINAGVVEQEGDQIRLIDSDHPEASVILASCSAEFPEASADLALSALAGANLPAILRGEDVAAPRARLLVRYENASLRLQPAVEALAGCVSVMAARIGADYPRHLHVVVAEKDGEAVMAALTDPVASGLMNGAMAGRLRLSIAAADNLAAERLARTMPVAGQWEIIDLSQPQSANADVVLLCAPAERRMSPQEASALVGLLRAGGVLLTAQPAMDALVGFHRGSAPVEGGQEEGVTLAPMLRDLPELGGVTTMGQLDEGLVVHISERKRVIPAAGRLSCTPVMAAGQHGVHSAQVQRALAEAGWSLAAQDAAAPDRLFVVEKSVIEDMAASADALRKALFAARGCDVRSRLWVVAMAQGELGAERVAALRAFVRVAMNEMVEADIRFVEIGAGVDDKALGLGLSEILMHPGREREFSVTPQGVNSARMLSGLPLSGEPAMEAMRLHFPRPGQLENFQWIEVPRHTPPPGHIEVELVATGLNFRDVMLAMGLLFDDVLDEGLAGAVYGLECAGRVVALGEGVHGFALGDLVMGFGQNSFASHAIGPQEAFVPVPEGVSAEAAAGLPVAFYTAWYALVELARLRAGETVLIHGGAGGVGLAAIQIARAVGAKVIATVSSPDKAALARLYGADHICDSRSLDFVDEVRDLHGGADVVLNSLSGEAMRGSIKVLRARGRFIELGKRDYVANSLLALRPFRRNLSYFGVDVDQILALDPELTLVGLKAIEQGFAEGVYMPLPVTTYRAGQISEAFRLMQSAGHVGKIVVSAPQRDGVPSLQAPPFAPGKGVQLIVGGTRGFGLATALWLAGKGAEKIVVASRAGAIDPEVLPVVERLRAQGMVFEVASLDVTDAVAVEALVKRITARHGPLGGVWHTAVTLSDGMLEGLDQATLDKVLAPKVLGAENLHHATLDQPLAHFVMFSSASALIGNPGQGAYAAANGWLEGLARRRMGAGRPALAVQWGAIADVGLLAARGDTLESLSRIAGVTGMQSADALARLDKVLALAGRLTDPVVTISDFAEAGALFSLPVPASPAFAGQFTVRGSSVAATGQSLSEMIAGLSEADALKVVATMLAEEAAAIMRLAVADVDLDASIDSLGMDSLMALELRIGIESRYKIELPMMAISAVGNLRELAQRVLVIARGSEEAAPAAVLSDAESALLAIHTGDAGVAETEILGAQRHG
ncbi:type I polyketide synthase [Novosphingobium sediminicola]|uniref:Acyl transferase domain-containing protein/NADPH:quinone reductase-like Zn-dependent oxidoreductase/acyl carrier protein n=1 Tax=Novosphingobium sediminicola TaxID=563162 RepID=A0A7W6G8P7_9SPHN|nr:acyl transferase domain-containing protein/NADPH:quinone reductase-like Zn-dependent oxidoreductase/acyl carrier protein [Novosphingobium sediminicola]